MVERPNRPIGDNIEAGLALAWPVIFVVGVMFAVFVAPLFYVIVVVVVFADWWLLRRRVARRLQVAPEDRKMLRLWTSQRGVYWAIQYLRGNR